MPIIHYGVKGMQWGKRKTRSSSQSYSKKKNVLIRKATIKTGENATVGFLLSFGLQKLWGIGTVQAAREARAVATVVAVVSGSLRGVKIAREVSKMDK